MSQPDQNAKGVSNQCDLFICRRMPASVYRLQHSGIALIFLASVIIFADMLCYTVFLSICKFWLIKIGGEERIMTDHEISVFFEFYAAGLLFFTPIFGIVSDILRDRKYLVLLSLISLGILSMLFMLDKPSYTVLLVLRTLQGAAAAGNWTIALALVYDCFPPASLGSKMGIVMSSVHFSYIFGPLLAGYLFKHYQMMAVSIMMASCCAIATLLRLFVCERNLSCLYKDKNCDLERKTTLKNSLFGYSLLLARPIYINSACIFMFGCILSAFEVTLQGYLSNDPFNLDSESIGLSLIAISIPGLLLSPVCGFICDKFSNRITLFCAIIAMSATMLVIAFIPKSFIEVICALTLYGCVHAFVSTPPLPEMGSYVSDFDPLAAGKVYALFSVAFALAMLVGPLLGAQLFDLSKDLKYFGIAFSMLASLMALIYGLYMTFPGWKAPPFRL